MGPLLALASAGLAGSADYWGARASRGLPPLVVVAAGHLVGVLALMAVVVVWPQSMTSSAVLLGIISGALVVVAQLCLYAGYRLSDVGLVAPTTATVGVAVPVLYGLAIGERPSGIVTLGLLFGLVGISQLSLGGSSGSKPRQGDRTVRRGLGYALAAGVSFGALFIAFSYIDTSDAVPAMVINRMAAGALAAVVAGKRWFPVRSLLPMRWLLVASGLFGIVANLTYILSLDRALMTVSVMLASMYPVATIGLARMLDGELLGAHRIVGLIVSLIAVSMVIVG